MLAPPLSRDARTRPLNSLGLAKAPADTRVVVAMSGGVDSSVVAALLARAIGPQLSCILVDNGLLRKDEEESVIREFSGHFKTDLHVVKAEDRFLAALAGADKVIPRATLEKLLRDPNWAAPLWRRSLL